MLRKTLIASLLSFSLFGCGGGGGDSTAPDISDGGGSPITQDPLAEYINIESSYSGLEVRANINRETMSSYMPYFFMLVGDLLPSNLSAESSNSELQCTGGGDVQIQNTANDDEKKIVFSQCDNSGVTIDGTATLRADKFDVNGQPVETTLIYQNVKFYALGEQFTLKGTLNEETLKSHCDSYNTKANLLFLHENTQQQLYFSNFNIRDTDLSCGSAESGILAYGRIFDSELGFVQVETSKAFKLNDRYWTSEKQGEVKFIGADNSQAIWTVKNYQHKENSTTSLKVYHHIQIDENGDSSNEFDFKIPHEIISDDLLTSFMDSDQDGLTDEWELAFGLDPQNPADANLDLDGDGYSNLDEFLYLGLPTDPNTVPFVYDFKLELTHTALNYGSDIPLTVNISNESPQNSLFEVLKLVLTVEQPISFVGLEKRECDANSGCDISQDGSQLTLTIDTKETGGYIVPSIDFWLTADKNITDGLSSYVNASLMLVSDKGYDRDLANNEADIVVSRGEIDPEYWKSATLTTEDGKRLSAHKSLLKVNETAQIEFELSETKVFNADLGAFTKDEVPNAYIEVVAPDFVELSEFLCTISGVESQCESPAKIAFYKPHEDAKVDFKFSMTGLSQGHGFIFFRVKSETITDKIFGEYRLPVIVGESTEVLQSLINKADPNDIVEVEPGIYVGPLDISEKKVAVKAKDDGEATYLYGELNFSDHPVKMNHGSSLIGFTIANHKIQVGELGGSFRDNKLEGAEFSLSNVDFFTSGSFDFIANEINAKNLDERLAESLLSAPSSLSRCSSIRMQLKEYDVKPNLKIENNLYVGSYQWQDGEESISQNGCVFISPSAGNVEVTNNTFSGLQSLLLFRSPPSYATGDYDITFTNNVITKSRFVVGEVFDNTQTFAQRLSIVLESNLLYEFESILDETWNQYIIDSIQQTNSIHLSPLLNDDFSLTSNSPAIDAGLDNALSRDLLNNLRPVDGNEDGIADIDIGAFEYQPVD